MVAARRQIRPWAWVACIGCAHQVRALNSTSGAINTSPSTTSAALPSTPTVPVCGFAANLAMVYDWNKTNAETITHTIVPHVTTYPNGSAVTSLETIAADQPEVTDFVRNTAVIDGWFTMTYPETWVKYVDFWSANCTKRDLTIPGYDTKLVMPATTDPAKFFYTADPLGWDVGPNPATVTPAMIEYLAGLQTVVEQMSGEDIRTCTFATCAQTAVGHSMVSASVLIQATETAEAVHYTAPAPSSTERSTAEAPSPPATTAVASPTEHSASPAPTLVSPPDQPPEPEQPPSQGQPSDEQPAQSSVQALPSEESPVPQQPNNPISSVEVTIITGEGSNGAAPSRTPVGSEAASVAPTETTFVRTVTPGGQTLIQTVVSPVANPAPAEVTLVETVSSDGHSVVQTLVSILPPPNVQASEITLVRTATSEGNTVLETVVSISQAAVGDSQASEVTLVETITSGGSTVYETLISIAHGSAGGEQASQARQVTFLRTVTSDGRTQVQTVVSAASTGDSPAQTTFTRTVVSDGQTYSQTVVSPIASETSTGSSGASASSPVVTADAGDNLAQLGLTVGLMAFSTALLLVL
ncbi:hypothetical protein KVR01_009307 [Diaporthe batatas]|uniref:uncharacterized protein n=1 Tax=Diaporthe batatas TaxID=748121 RepID=UPI001D03C456|nr:uncharacterized protein KVR01_009307 [Diaporthe batatas]KAG8161043.1 hypothetical protein KVR01_009307 [Diaporthe batatas]